jgi:hypothetical protein
MRIEQNKLVALDYTLTLDSGEVIDKSESGDPLLFLHGGGTIISGLEKQLLGLEPGAKAKITVEAEEGYGAVNPELVQKLPKRHFPDEVAAGMTFEAQGAHGPVVLLVREVTGADDYITKPFSPRELLARIKAVLRRRAPQLTDDVIDVAGLRLEPATRCVTAGGRDLHLGPTEFRLLHFLMTHQERVHSRAQLLDQVWGDHVFVDERTVDVHIRRLRQALSTSGHELLIRTVRGAGYRFCA